MTDARPDDGQWNPMIKLSDEKGKYIYDPETILLAKKVLGIEGWEGGMRTLDHNFQK